MLYKLFVHEILKHDDKEQLVMLSWFLKLVAKQWGVLFSLWLFKLGIDSCNSETGKYIDSFVVLWFNQFAATVGQWAPDKVQLAGFGVCDVGR